jgi:hypothetical protein
VNPYGSWRQVAGYFDGDGNFSITDLSNQPFKLGLQIIFTDQSQEQISMLRTFLVKRGIIPSNVLKTSKGTASMIAIGTFDGVLAAAIAMLPYLFKKSNEAIAVIDYYEGRISGNDLVAIFKQEVEAGRRERRNHTVKIDVPYTYVEGDAMMKMRRRQRIREVFTVTRAKVTRQDFEAIREQHFIGGKRLRDLVKEYPQYARETIRRVLGGGRGYVGVKGVGRVDTADNR